MASRVTLHSSFDSLQEEWDRLLPLAATNTLFLTTRWQRVWWEAFTNGERLMLAAFHRDGELLGIAPMMQQEGQLSFLGDTDLFDYHDFIVLQGEEEDFYTALVEYLAEEEWGQLRLVSLPEGSPTLEYLPELARARNWQCQVEQEDVVPGIVLPQDWDSYLLGLRGKDRHELRRKLRRLDSVGGTEFAIASTPESVREGVEDLLRLMSEGREEKRDFLTPLRQQFLRSVTQELAAQGTVRLCHLDVDGQRAAVALCFDYGDQRLLYNSGFDAGRADLSVGLLMKALALKAAITDGMKYFDFLRGNERYKYDLGGSDRGLYRLVVTR